MLVILNSLNAHNLPIFQPISMILVSKFMVHRALSDKTYLSLGLLPPLIHLEWHSSSFRLHQIFPSLKNQMLFFRNSTNPGPIFRKVGKSLLLLSNWSKPG